MWTRNRVGLGLSYQATWAGGIYSLESIPGLHKLLKIRALDLLPDNLNIAAGLFYFPTTLLSDFSTAYNLTLIARHHDNLEN
jgi:hypothetical protein